MVTITTLFLGLVTGSWQVEVSATAPVARIELLLDSSTVGVDEAPPWSFEVDFGDEPAPHRLTAVGFDAEGAEVARTAIPVNLQPRESGLSVVIEEPETGEKGKGAPVARLTWSSIDGSAPTRLAAWFDGNPIEVGTGEDRYDRLLLPAVDLGGVHFLTVEMTFASGALARTERVFGSDIDRMINTRNTAVAIDAHRRRDRLDSPEEARGLILAGGEPATPVGLEDDGTDLVVVRDRSAHRELVAMTGGRPITLAGRRNDRMFLIAPAPDLVLHRSGPYELFPITPALSGARGSLFDWLVRLEHDPSPGVPEELAGAVSVAGMRAASGGRPRAVLLMIGPESFPVAVEDAERARRFLARLGVPLAVWRIQRDLKDLEPQERLKRLETEVPPIDRATALAEARAAWGEVEDVGAPVTASDAAKELLRRVDRQQVVWIDGEYLPTEITLAPSAQVELAGREP